MNRPAAATAAGRASQRHRENVAAGREPEFAPAATAVIEREPAPTVTAPPTMPRHRGSLGRPATPPAERPTRPRRRPRQRPERQPRSQRQPHQRAQSRLAPSRLIPSRPAPERERVQQPKPQRRQAEPQPQRATEPRRRSFSLQTGRELTAGLHRPHLPRLSELRPGSLLVDRIIRGRLWIPVLGVLLVAIVTMRVEVLRLDVRNTQATALAAQLQSVNQQEQARVSDLSSTSRIEALATRYGLHMPGPMDVHFVKSESGSSSQLKRAMSSITKPDGSTYSSAVASEQAGNVASEASITGTTDTTSTDTTSTDTTSSDTTSSDSTSDTASTDTTVSGGTGETTSTGTTSTYGTSDTTDATSGGATADTTSTDTGSASTAGSTGGTGE